MVQLGEVHEGMHVHTAEGRHVGWVTGVGDVHFEFEPRIVPVRPRDYLVDYRDVASVRGNDVFLEPTAQLELEDDDDGSALPPRSYQNVDREPVNADEPHPGA